MSESNFKIVVESFVIEGKFESSKPFGNGHINDTRAVITKDEDGNTYNYILQKINSKI